jgi:hypothetical protein
MNNPQILAKLRELLADKFEVDPARITPRPTCIATSTSTASTPSTSSSSCRR